ncbi:hypothetical protein SMQC13_02830 [Serratia marcescens]|nr:hypothetical protein SMQC13_02830 [Serratia marcescens]
MDEKKLKALAAELAKGLKTEADLNVFSRMLTKLTVETALNAELTDHLGHEKNAPKTGSNTRNGYSSKTVLCDITNSILCEKTGSNNRFPTRYFSVPYCLFFSAYRGSLVTRPRVVVLRMHITTQGIHIGSRAANTYLQQSTL